MSSVDDLSAILVDRLKQQHGKRLLVGIAGVPASGKSTLALAVVNKINAIHNSGTAVLVGLDGWHYTRAMLDTFDDPKNAHDRRGASWTFDAASFVSFVETLRSHDADSPDESARVIMQAPSFSHELKDPKPDDIDILSQHRIVIFEGLYCLLDLEPWRQAAHCLDERIALSIDPGLAKARLINRHVLTGVAKDNDEAVWRAESSDIPNGVQVESNLYRPTRTIMMS